MSSSHPQFSPWWLAAPGIVALLLEPALWLLTTWRDPTYDSAGGWVALACAALVAWSVRSGQALGGRASGRALQLMMATAALRLAGRLLAVRVVGALALVVDVYALALLLGTARRPRPVHPGWLALLFACALPIEHLLQRVVAHPLRVAAATSAEAVLAPFFPALSRTGTLLLHPEVALSVDLPCSGARGLTLLVTLFCALAAIRRPGLAGATAGFAAAAFGALLANALRVAGLFLGVRAGWPVLAEPWHSVVGLVALAAGAVPLLAVARRWELRRPRPARSTAPLTGRRATALALAVSFAGVAIAAVPGRPIDISRPVPAAPLPTALLDAPRVDLPTTDTERAYYTRYGGGLAKAAYGPHTALIVRTTAPLRHLHGPDTCLLGAGHTVERLGIRADAIPTVVWRSTDPDGYAWRVEASFVPDDGPAARDLSEVVWRWLGDVTAGRTPPTWALVERITPWDLCEARPDRCADFDDALFGALDIHPPTALAARAEAVR